MDFSSIDLIVSVGEDNPLCITAPATLQEVLETVSKHVMFPACSILYNRKGTWVKIVNEQTYTNIVNRALAAGADELELKVEPGFSGSEGPSFTEENWSIIDQTVQQSSQPEPQPLIDSVPQPLVDSVPQALIEREPEPVRQLLYYRRLNGPVDGFVSIAPPHLDITLAELSALIIRQEQLQPTWTCALYSECGYPLTNTLAQTQQTKCSDVLRYDERLCLFTVPHFDKKNLDPIDPTIGADTVILGDLSDATITHSVKVNLGSSTVEDLKRKLHFITGLPTYEIKLQTDDTFLSQDSKTLHEYGLVENSLVKFSREEQEYTLNSYKAVVKQSVEQTETGQRVLHSFLHCFAKNIATCEIPLRENFLAGVRSVSKNCTPLVQALYELAEGKKMTLLNTIALEEGFILVCRNVLREVFNLEGATPPAKLLESTLEVCALIIEFFSKPEVETGREEQFKVVSLIDPLTYETIKQPVLVTKTDGTQVYYEYQSLLDKLSRQEAVDGAPHLTLQAVTVDDTFLPIFRRCLLNKKQELVLWTGTFMPSPTVVQLINRTHSGNFTWDQCETLAKSFKITKIMPQQSLKDPVYKNCLTLNKDRRISLNLGLSPKLPNKVDLMDIITRETTSMDIDELATAIQVQKGEEAKEVITRDPEEAIVVVFDKSGSMGQNFCNDVEYSRIGATKQFFETFVDRTVGYEYLHVMSLILFSNEIKLGCSFTENLNSFAYVVHQSEAGGGTRLWDSIIQAVDALADLKLRYPACRLRILCLSDGEDNGSRNGSWLSACQYMLQHEVVMDSVVVGMLSEDLKTISFATGGFVFLPNTINEGIKLFENEAFLSARNREAYSPPVIRSAEDLAPFRARTFSNGQPQMRAPQQASQRMVSAAQAVQQSSSQPAPKFTNARVGASYKRIQKELTVLATDPHPSVVVYPSADDQFFWNAYMTGPEMTPYAEGTFQLYVKFPSDYPFRPPDVRFLTPIYHCNINSAGRICHSILKDFYSPAVTMRNIFDAIFGLLMTPEPGDPLDAHIAAEYLHDYPAYEANATAHTRQHASLSVAELTGAHKPPAEFLDPISGDLMEDPVLVPALNKTFERRLIEKVIQETGKDPSGAVALALTDLVPNADLKQQIEAYKASNP